MQCDPNRNRCTETCSVVYADLLMKLITDQKLGQSDLLYRSKLPAEKWV